MYVTIFKKSFKLGFCLFTLCGNWSLDLNGFFPYIYSENNILKGCVITLDYVEIVFVSIIAVKQNVLNPDGCFHSSESYLREVGGKRCLGDTGMETQICLHFLKLVKRILQGRKWPGSCYHLLKCSSFS